MLYQTVMCFLCVAGVVAIIWALVMAVFRPKRQGPVCLVASPSDARGLIGCVEQIRWLRQWGCDARLVIIIDGLDDEGRHIADILEKDGGAIRACRMEELNWHDGRELNRTNPVSYLWQ